MTGNPAQTRFGLNARPQLLPILLALTVCQAVFASVPTLDIWVSSLFYEKGGGFWLARSQSLIALRDCFRLVPWVVGLIAAALAIHQYFRADRLGARPFVLICASLIVGPGLLVNGLLKEHWGRARPDAIEQYGGTAHFTPAFQIAHECAHNCSFTSGEAASLSTTAMVLSVVTWPWTSTATRFLLMSILSIIAGAGSFLRVMMGRHFLSDILFSFLLCALVILVLEQVLDFAFGNLRQPP
jgi:lipid A 4'-phosphatase